MSRVARQSTAAEIAALEHVCDRVAGFGADVSLEWVDGFVAALVAGPRALPSDEWLPAMFGDAFERAFADPADVAQALGALQARWQVVASQLDAESLFEDPDRLRLQPLMISDDAGDRRQWVETGQMSADEAAVPPQTGALWAEGFMAAVHAFAADWPEADTQHDDALDYDSALTDVVALTLPPAELTGYLAEVYPGQSISRDELIDAACLAVQDLRMYWVDHAPRPATRHVEARPGRNDPCPCGSGRKYKKCHGAVAP